MSARLVILLVLAVILGVALYAKMSAAPPAEARTAGADDNHGISREELAKIRECQKTLPQRDLPGEEPVEPPELSAQIEVDRASDKNRLCIYITEAHGYYVETFRLRAWFKGRDEASGEETRIYEFGHIVNKYLKANDTLKECLEVVPAELAKFGGDIGTDEDWGVEIAFHGRARMQDPDPLPRLCPPHSREGRLIIGD
jgi:hypothetical protein